MSSPACLGAARGPCEGGATFRVTYRRSTDGRLVDTEDPWCFRHGLERVDRAHAAGSMARVELVPIPGEQIGPTDG